MSNRQYNQISRLVKIINSWNLIPGASTHEFDTMANKILSHLQKGADLEKIQNIIASDLVAIYGFYNYEIDATAFAQEIVDWWVLEQSV
ncbi:hypothetical protein [Sphingobacterium gobiense]|uniref:DUF1871 domain-containing protein n=1 Tax=Sphingobacterium gobiense TaxID=1382456 RepID=A0A2S9JTZ7_9SPHI|nr:hypothetical protein [Sphingobacterium gobiense]PRD56739.1 hypothetical protein C5749_05785 [Sphingobacterium gobiense]